METEEDSLYVCYNCCRGDKFLQGRILENGILTECSYCNKRYNSIKISTLAKSINTLIDEHFIVTPDEPNSYQYAMQNDPDFSYDWERRGQPLNEIINDITNLNEEATNDIINYLSDNYGPGLDDYYLEDPYTNAFYEESRPDSSRLQREWQRFCNEITRKSRYFNPVADEILASLFQGLDSLKSSNGKSAIRLIGPSTEANRVYRARVATSPEQLERILINPSKELAAPPFNFAGNGRMNAVGISVFYGAENSETCISEVRPPVGSSVVVGEFKIIRQLRLLDLDVLSNVFVTGSFFDEGFLNRKQHAAFLNHLVTELTTPVLPGEEALKYLPTQMVAEYLSEKSSPKIDGIAFKSSQDENRGENIILFRHACLVEPYTIPSNAQVSVNYGWRTEEDFDDSITISERIPFKDNKEVNSAQNSPQIPAPPHEAEEVSLRLDAEHGVEVFEIQGTRYMHKKRHTSRYRYKVGTGSEDF